MKKVYLATPITFATEEQKLELSDLAKKIGAICELNEYWGLADAAPADVYEYDRKCMDNSDLIIAEVSRPSLGVGYEIGYALSKGKKVVAFGKENVTVTRMIRGITDLNFTFRTYKTVDEIIDFVKRL